MAAKLANHEYGYIKKKLKSNYFIKSCFCSLFSFQYIIVFLFIHVLQACYNIKYISMSV